MSSVNDPVGDMLTRIRNKARLRRAEVDIPFSQLKEGIARVLQEEGYIEGYRVVEQVPQPVLQVRLKYGPRGETILNHVQRVSRPGRRIYRGSQEIGRSLDGLGIFILSTNRGVLSDRRCKREGVGGEVLCEVW